MWFGPLFMVVLVVLVVAAVVALVRGFAGVERPPSSMSPSPRDILDQRFARGEIDAEDYEARKRALEK